MSLRGTSVASDEAISMQIPETQRDCFSRLGRDRNDGMIITFSTLLYRYLNPCSLDENLILGGGKHLNFI